MAPPESLLFLSCDIVGSTRFKQNNVAATWQRTFLAFYRQFPQALANVVNAGPDRGGPFTLWKGIGDELIFTCPVVDEVGVYRAVRTWLEAMDDYEADTLDGDLGTKGGAFIATFPSPDRRCSIPRNPDLEASDMSLEALNQAAIDQDDHNLFQYDYFGPSIDTGFRIVSASSHRHFTLSVEVAWAMQRCAHASQDDPAQIDSFPMGDVALLEAVTLKGVWSDRSYPIFAIDRRAADPVNVAMRKLQGTGASLGDIGALCSACLTADGWPSRLFLPASSYGPFTIAPEDDALIDNLMEGAETEPGEGEGADLPADAPVE